MHEKWYFGFNLPVSKTQVIPFDKVINIKLTDKIKLLRLKTILPLFIMFAAVSTMMFPFTLNDASAHAPTGVKVSIEGLTFPSSNGVNWGGDKESADPQLRIHWFHGVVGACASSTACEANLAGGGNEVDITRDGTSIANNVTGGLTEAVSGGVFVDGNTASLAQGQAYTYVVCHGEASTSGCTAAQTDGTNEGKASPVVNATKSTPPCLVQATYNGTLVTECDATLDVSSDGSYTINWVGPTYNNTDIASWWVEKSLVDGTYTNVTGNISSGCPTIASSGHCKGLTGSGVRSANASAQTTGALELGSDYLFRISSVTTSGFSAKTVFQFSVPNEDDRGSIAAAPVVSNFSLGNNAISADRTPSQTVEVDSLVFTGGSSTNVQATVFEEKGWDRILNVALLFGDDTSVAWNYFDGTTVVDPNGYFREAGVTAAESGVRTLDVDIAIKFAKTVAGPEVTLEITNFMGKSKSILVKEAEEIVEAQEAPPSNVVENLELASPNCDCGGVKYYTSDDLINVSFDSISLVKNTAVQEEETITQKLFDSISLRQETTKVDGKYADVLIISGTLNPEFYDRGHFLSFTIPDADNHQSKISAVVTFDATFSVPIYLDGLAPGQYEVQPNYWNYSEEILSEPIPFRVLE